MLNKKKIEYIHIIPVHNIVNIIIINDKIEYSKNFNLKKIIKEKNTPQIIF